MCIRDSTSAMKMVSAAKLKKAQDAIIAMRPYSDKLTELMKSFSGSVENNKFINQRRLKNILIIVNKGHLEQYKKIINMETSNE